MQKPEIRIENWEIRKERWRLSTWYIYGTVYGHPKFSDGDDVSTSKIISVNPEEKKAETLNSVYMLLGEPANEGEKEKLIKLKEILDGMYEKTPARD